MVMGLDACAALFFFTDKEDAPRRPFGNGDVTERRRGGMDVHVDADADAFLTEMIDEAALHGLDDELRRKAEIGTAPDQTMK